MIYYFSGTGNSRWVAEKIAMATNDDAIQMQSPGKTGNEVIGLIFPVYAWGLPRFVKKFIKEKLPLLINDNVYVYCVMTCGDDMGYTDVIMKRILQRYCHLSLDAVFSVHMPNTYVCLPGFDVDSNELAKKKVDETIAALPHIADIINDRGKAVEVCRGSLPWIKTYIIRPLFDKVLVTDKYFHCDTSLCTKCQSCIKHCPLGNITLETTTETISKGETSKTTIQWHHNCTGCLGCYHICPHHAINFGNQTQKKGQKKQIM